MDIQTENGEHSVDEQKIVLDDKENIVYIRNVVIKDKDLHDILSAMGNLERIEIFDQIVRAGTISTMAVKGFSISERVNKEFADLMNNFDNMLRERFGDKVEEYLGPSGRLEKEIFDINNPESSLSRFKKMIDDNSCLRDEKILEELQIIQKDMTDKIDKIIIENARSLGKKEIYEKSTQKGGEFEDIVHYFLNNATANNFDVVKNISRTYGKKGTKGDFLIETYDTKQKILIEAKSKVDVVIGYANRYLDECLENWPDTNFSILVYDKDPSGVLNGIRFEKDSRIICEFGDEGIILGMAYRIARICVTNEHDHIFKLRQKDKECKSIMSNFGFGISRVTIRNELIETIRHVNKIVEIRKNLKKSFDIYSNSFNRSIVDMDNFKNNIGGRLSRIEKMLRPQEKDIEEKIVEQVPSENLEKEDMMTEIKDEDISTGIREEYSSVEIKDDVPKEDTAQIKRKGDIEDAWGC